MTPPMHTRRPGGKCAAQFGRPPHFVGPLAVITANAARGTRQRSRLRCGEPHTRCGRRSRRDLKSPPPSVALASPGENSAAATCSKRARLDTVRRRSHRGAVGKTPNAGVIGISPRHQGDPARTCALGRFGTPPQRQTRVNRPLHTIFDGKFTARKPALSHRCFNVFRPCSTTTRLVIRAEMASTRARSCHVIRLPTAFNRRLFLL